MLGLRALGVRDLSYRLAVIANYVQVHALLNATLQSYLVPIFKKYLSKNKLFYVIFGHISDGRRDGYVRNRKRDVDEEDNQQFLAEEMDEIERMRNTPDFFNKIVDSIASTLFGHQEIKKVVPLMLVGAVHKFTHEGINLRGDINVCIVGDPICAKSQFLKYTTNLVPRSVYISGKSSSVARLTATVAKEPATVAKEPEPGEFCIGLYSSTYSSNAMGWVLDLYL